MKIKTPKFWNKVNFISLALLPLSFIYLCGFLINKFFTKTHKISKPIICIGNLIAGGSGKTPTAIAIGEILNELSINFAYLSRGYMGDGSKFLLLHKDDGSKAEQVGDEPLLLIDTAPTFVAKNRLFGALQIEVMNKFSAIVLDDGMQNDSLHRDFTIMVVDGKIGFGNNFLLPAGPKRELLSMGLKKTDLIILIGKTNDDLLKKLSSKKIIKANLLVRNLEDFIDQKLIAFCGLAYPQKFFDILSSKGMEVIENQGFPDHHFYQSFELERLCNLAKLKNATLVTTKKDWIKFPKIFQNQISYLDVFLEFEDKQEVAKLLKTLILK